VSAAIGATIRLPILLPICLAIHLPVLLPILMAVHLSICLTVFPAIRLTILPPIRPPIFLTDIRLREYHIRQDGWGRHSHDQAGNRTGFQQIVLHNACSFCVREWVINVSCSC
jgi:hypothetical protein